MTPRRDWFGALVGLATFLGGVALLLLTFRLAYDLFTVPPERALGAQPGQALDLPMAGQSLTTILLRVLLLIVMAAVGSLIANRGVSLYVGSGGRMPSRPSSPPDPEPAQE